MLIYLFSSFLFCTSTSAFLFMLFLFMLLWLSESSFYFEQSILDASYSSFLSDTISCWLVPMLVFVVFFSSFFLLQGSYSECVSLALTLVFCVFVFSSGSLFTLYFFYEASLFPILYIIIKWGSYPERSLSAFILLAYTVIFTLPFLFVLFTVYSNVYSFAFSVFLPPLVMSLLTSGVIPFLVFFAFAVKLPVYGLHFWLPMAHVEAPTFGSIVLAGVLLKLGGVGLLRLSPYVSCHNLTTWVLGYSVVGLILVTLICCFQSDFNRLVAFSSVSHMMALPPLLVFDTAPANLAVVLLIVFHGLSSPILFMLVGVSYSIVSSRQFLAVRGFITLSPLVSLFLVLAFLFTMSAPPFPSFVSEVFFISVVINISYVFIGAVAIFAFLSIVYNLLWLSSMVFSSSAATNQNLSFSYMSFLSLSSAFLVSFLFLIFLLCS